MLLLFRQATSEDLAELASRDGVLIVSDVAKPERLQAIQSWLTKCAQQRRSTVQSVQINDDTTAFVARQESLVDAPVRAIWREEAAASGFVLLELQPFAEPYWRALQTSKQLPEHDRLLLLRTVNALPPDELSTWQEGWVQARLPSPLSL